MNNDLLIVDLKQAIASTGSESLAREIIGMFLAKFPTDREAIEIAYTNQDWPLLTQLVHKFHGGCAYAGVPKLKATTQSLEQALKAEPMGDIDALFQAFLDVMIETEDAAQSYIQG